MCSWPALRLVLLGLALTSCGLLEVGPASKITSIEPISVRVRVVELGPLNPGRVAFPSTAPISEFMPGDRVRLEVEVVDTDGLALADDELDSLWLQCGGQSCRTQELRLRDPEFEQPCAELEDWTADSRCRLGQGRGGFEFQAPPIGEATLRGFCAFYVVVAWDGQRAEDCWAARLADVELPLNCAFLQRSARIGPSWWMLAAAASFELGSSVPLDQLPPAALAQQANRVPVLDHVEVSILGQPGVLLLPVIDGVVGPVAVRPDDVVGIASVLNPNQQFSQSYILPFGPEFDTFTLIAEEVFMRVSTAGPITTTREGPVPTQAPIEILVHEDAQPGIARVVVVVHDDRGAEGVIRVELEVQ